MNIFLSPHSDDEALFGSFIIQRLKPTIVIVTDGTTHEKKFNLPIEERRKESEEAAKIFGCKIIFLGIPEDELSHDKLRKVLEEYEDVPGFVFAPAKQGGQPQHDIVSDVAKELYPNTLFYSTYTRENFTPVGEIAINPTPEEVKIKDQALACFKSQIAINGPHFEAVKGVPEYLNFKQ